MTATLMAVKIQVFPGLRRGATSILKPMGRQSVVQCLLALMVLTPLVCQVAGRPKILVHGHRGARARRPENTLPAFQYAIEQGVDVLELDVAVTKDNVLVVSAD